jgi:phosphomannomutase
MSTQLDLAAVRAWRDHDPDPATRAELTQLLEALPESRGELEERFRARLAFGTAGLRGRLGAGPGCMNRAVVRQTAAGLADHLLATTEDASERGVLIGYDGRHGSREMAQDTAGVLTARGIRALLIPRTAPTPLVAFGVVQLGTAAGVVVTASHNPPQDNGFKVYWGNGAQIIPPHDREIAAAILADLARLGPPGIGDAAAIPLLSREEAIAAGLWSEPGTELEQTYLRAVAAALPAPPLPKPGANAPGSPPAAASDLVIVYTPLHGVGKPLALRALAAAGFDQVHVVAEQAEPDGDFPTVAFPNPEEPGALELALSLAAEVEADLLLANDPDADRLAVVARAADGVLVALDGNQIGTLLGDFLLAEALAAGTAPERCLLVSSIVSSAMLGRIAAAHNAHHESVLTGFKWICNRALELEATNGDLRFIFGYEEALGYSVGTTCRDKDGIGAAATMARLAQRLRHAPDGPLTLLDQLDRLYRRHGWHASRQKSIVLPGADGAARIAAIMEALRSDPPAALGGRRVLAISDILRGIRRDLATGSDTPLPYPESNVLRFELEGDTTVTARPSGTEPKIKFYFEVRIDTADRELEELRAEATLELEKLVMAIEELV